MRMTADDRMEASPSDVKNVAALLASDVGTAIVHVMDDLEVTAHSDTEIRRLSGRSVLQIPEEERERERRRERKMKVRDHNLSVQ